MKSLGYIVIVLLTVSCHTNVDEIGRLFIEKNENTETLSDVNLMYSDSGKVLLNLMADSMIILNSVTKPMDEFPLGILVHFYDSRQNVISTLVSDYAVREKNDNKVIARENVILSNDKGDTLWTEELIWNEKTRNLNSTQFVKIKTAKEVIYGFGFKTNEKFTRYEINNISGRTQIDDIADEFN